MRGRPGCPTEQKKTSVGAIGGSPLFLRLQGKVGYRIAPSSAPVCALGHLPPKGKALGRWERSEAVVGLLRAPCLSPDLESFFHKNAFQHIFLKNASQIGLSIPEEIAPLPYQK